jgi:hypothetical protein
MVVVIAEVMEFKGYGVDVENPLVGTVFYF